VAPSVLVLIALALSIGAQVVLLALIRAAVNRDRFVRDEFPGGFFLWQSGKGYGILGKGGLLHVHQQKFPQSRLCSWFLRSWVASALLALSFAVLKGSGH